MIFGKDNQKPACECRLCSENREIDRLKEQGTREELAAKVADLWNRLGCAEHDNEYYKAIMDGSWPQAKEIAQVIIARVEKQGS